MEQSIFIQFVKERFGPLVAAISKTLNGADLALRYMHREMLTTDFSVTGKWEAINTINTLVAADVVSMDSPLPLKKRDSLGSTNGEIPKIGIELQLNERQLSDLDILSYQPGQKATLVKKLFEDTPRCIGGVLERLESIFLQALSKGYAEVLDMNNVGTSIRVDYGVPAENKLGVIALWSNPSTAKPIDDFQAIFDAAEPKGHAIKLVMMDQATFNRMVATDQVKTQFGSFQGNWGTNVFSPTLAQFNTMLNDKFSGWAIRIVTRTIVTQKNGVNTATTPWAPGQVTFLYGTQVGALTWSYTAEHKHRVPGVAYEEAGEMILCMKFMTNRPTLGEWTSAICRALPVLASTERIYMLDTLTVEV